MSDAKVIKPFNARPNGCIVHPGETLTVSDERHDDLAAVGLVEPRVKTKPKPDNKAKPAPANK